jgi:hypothetical protein
MKFCIYCPDSCERQDEHHHFPGKKFDSHPGIRTIETQRLIEKEGE